MAATKRKPVPTRAEERAADNVRPRGDLDPTDCLMTGMRPLFDRQNNCGTCGLKYFGSTAHCHLLEMCDHCHDSDTPCDTARQLAIRNDRGAPAKVR